MVTKEEHKTDEEHECHKHEKEDMELSGSIGQVPHPELDEVLKDSCSNEDTVKHRVREEQQEELVVRKTHTVVDPWTVMVHLQHTRFTNGAMVTAVGLQNLAAVTEPDSSGRSSSEDG